MNTAVEKKPRVEEGERVDLDAANPRGTINRSALSRELKVDVAHVSRILSGQRKPSLELAARMAQYLGLSLDQFYGILPR